MIPTFNKTLLPSLCFSMLLTACSNSDDTKVNPNADPSTQPFSITAYSPKLADLIDLDADIQVVAEGFVWSEGPVWIDAEPDGFLLFSDVPSNRMHRWSAEQGLSTFLYPSGIETVDPQILQGGTNGLIRYDEHHILAANHGDRELTLINLESVSKTSFVSRFEGKKFNSPNDLVKTTEGGIYFTDPPYGLVGIDNSPAKEIGFNGVYYLNTNKEISLISGGLKFPNGIGLLPDDLYSGKRTLIVSNSDPNKALWMQYTLDDDGNAIDAVIFFDASSAVRERKQGLPDGLAVDVNGNVFASGPGGIYIFSSAGELLGMINIDRAAANCTFGGNQGNTLFITATNLLLAVETNTEGAK